MVDIFIFGKLGIFIFGGLDMVFVFWILEGGVDKGIVGDIVDIIGIFVVFKIGEIRGNIVLVGCGFIDLIDVYIDDFNLI